MAEYIEREAALNKLCRDNCGHDYNGKCYNCYTAAFIEQYPAADVAPVVRAEWVVCGDGEDVPWMCSHCGKTTAHKYKTMYGKYCPNCGAHMKDGG